MEITSQGAVQPRGVYLEDWGGCLNLNHLIWTGAERELKMCLMLKQSSISVFRLRDVCAGWAKEEFSSCLCCTLVSATAVLFLPGALSDEGNGLVWLVGVKQSGGNDIVKGDQIQTLTLWWIWSSVLHRVASKGKNEERDARVVRNKGELGWGVHPEQRLYW